MKLKIILALAAIKVTLAWQAGAQTYDTNNVVVQTFAGSGFYGYLNGQGTQTMFYNPLGVVTDSSSNLFILDHENYRVRKITADATVSSFAGGGAAGLPGYGWDVSFSSYNFSSMTIDHSNAIWLTVANGYLVRIGNDAWVYRTLLNGVQWPWGVCADSQNKLYISDYTANKIYRFNPTNGVLDVFVGSGNDGSVDGNGVFTSFYRPAALAADAADNIYVWDAGNQLIRKINQNRDVVTIAGKKGVSLSSDGVGTNASFSSVSAMCADEFSNIILACGSSVRKISATTNVTTIAGSFTQTGYANGAGNLARFNSASGICVSQGVIFVADSNNQRIRSVTFDASTQPVLPANLQLSTYPGLQIIGTVGRTYQVQASPDITNWTTRATLLLNSSPYLWIDQNPVSGNKFYRAWLLP